MILRSCLSLLLLAASAWGQFYGPQFRVIPRSNGSATGELQFFGLTGANYLGFKAPGSVPTTLVWNFPTTDAVGALCSDGALNLYFGCVGGGTSITTLNTLSAAVQSLTTGVTGTAPNWTTSGTTTHILNLPFASTAGVTAGLISNTNFAAFTAKQDAISASSPIVFSSNIVSCPTCVAGTVSASNTPNTIALRDGAGGIVANIAYLTQGLLYPASAGTALLVRRGTSGQTDPLQVWADQTGSNLSTIDKDGNFTGRANTSLALASNPANCSAGQAAAGVDASGVAEGCFTPAGSGGNVNGSGTTVVGEVPAYTNTTATAIGPGYSVSTSNTANTLARRDASGGLVANIGYFTQTLTSPVSAATAIAARRGTSGQTDPIQTWATEGGSVLSSIDKDGKFTGNAATATALAANGSNCSAGQAAAGVDASGAAEGCFTPAGGGNVSGSGTSVVGDVALYTNTTSTAIGPGLTPYSGSTPASWINSLAKRDGAGDLYTSWFRGNAVSVKTGFFVDDGLPAISARRGSDGLNTGNIVEFKRYDDASALSAIAWDGGFTGNASSASTLAANPSNCSAGQAAAGVAADGTAEGCFTPSGGGGSSMGLYNVKDAAYGAVGDGSNDDTAEIQAAITACENSTRGGIVYFPPGTYAISSGLWHGNGSTSGSGNASTKAVCRFVGAGAGDDSIAVTAGNVAISVIKWTGSNPGSLTYMLTIDGPMVGFGLEHLKFWGNSNSNVVGVDLRQINFSHISDVSVSETGGGSGGAFAVKIWAQKTFPHFACYNTIENLRVRPYTNSVGSALWVGGNSTYGTACSINITGGYFNRDNNYTSGTNTATYGVLLDSSDNFHAAFTHFSTTGGNGARNGCSIGASPGAYAGAGSGVYPDSAHFYGISSGGMCGQTGTGRPWVVWGGECGAEGQGSCDFHNAFTGGGTRPIALSGESDASLKGMKEVMLRNGGGAGTVYESVVSTTGTTMYEMKRGGVTGAGIEINAFNEIQFKNPSFVEGYMKIRTSASANPGTCNSTNEGWLWSKAASAGVATTLVMCAADSSGTFAWRTVQTF